jgi:hypothetical protein
MSTPAATRIGSIFASWARWVRSSRLRSQRANTAPSSGRLSR